MEVDPEARLHEDEQDFLETLVEVDILQDTRQIPGVNPDDIDRALDTVYADLGKDMKTASTLEAVIEERRRQARQEQLLMLQRLQAMRGGVIPE